MLNLCDFSKRLKNARLMKGWSMDELCLHMEPAVSKMTISRFEKGELKPNATHLRALSDALELPSDYFLRPLKFQMEVVRFRKKDRVSEKVKKMIEHVSADLIERYVELEEMCGMRSKERITKYCVKDLIDAKCAAKNLRKEWNLEDGCIGNVVELLEKHGVVVIELEDIPGFDGLSAWVNDIYPIVVLAKNDYPERKRLTAFHELGHLVLNIDSALLPRKIENICNSFASEMLLPETALRKHLDLGKKDYSFYDIWPIQMEFGISFDAIMHKMKECGIITEKRYTGYRIYKNKNPGYKKLVEKNFWHEEHSSRLFRLVIFALNKGLITVSKAATLLGENLDFVAKEFAF